MEFDVGDGYVSIQETAECRYEVEFENTLNLATKSEINFDTLTILLDRGNGAAPDDVYIHDRTTGRTYHMVVEDWSTGVTCVPWPLVG